MRLKRLGHSRRPSEADGQDRNDVSHNIHLREGRELPLTYGASRGLHELDERLFQLRDAALFSDDRPDGDAMSQLILTVLSGVAEFERSLIAERTALAAKVARQAGRAWGRRPEPGPQPLEVKALRANGASWSRVAEQLRCTVGMARRRAAAA